MDKKVIMAQKETSFLIIYAKKKNKKPPHKCIALYKLLFNKTVNDSTKIYKILQNLLCW